MGSYNYYKMFGCFNRKFKISESEPPPDVIEAFARYAEGAPHLTADQLCRFLVDYQGDEGCTVPGAEAIMQQVYHRRHHSSRRRGLTIEDFFYFLFQDDINGPINSKVHHDMTAPLQHYFIYTGHNSYLTGNQLSSDCSELPIIRSLENGVRGIELDLWPNSGKDNIHVLHGRTLTTPVPLIKCLKSIREHAFVASPYPVIITLEDHLTPDLQAKVAEMVTQIFGDMLYCPESGRLEEFPSPETLKHRIILSTKPPKEYLGSNYIKDGDEKDSSEDDLFGKEASDPAAGEKSDSDQDDEDRDNPHQKSGKISAPGYKRLVAIQARNAKKGLRRALRTDSDKADRLSMSGHGLETDASLYSSDVVRYSSDGDEKDSSVDDLFRKEASDPPNGEKNDGDQNDDNDNSHQKSGNIAAPEYKRLIAIDPRNAEKGLRRALRTEMDKSNRLSVSEQGLETAASLSSTDVVRYSNDGDEKDSSDDELFRKEASNPAAGELSDSDQDNEDSDNSQRKSGKFSAPEYKRLIAIHARNVKKGLRRALRTEMDKANRLSMSEQGLEKAASLYSTEVVRFTQKNILRVFPKGTRVTSSNFKPITGWMHGAQMVAFNMQECNTGYGKSLWMMQGLFRSNGCCGYFKKPDLLMKTGPNGEVFDLKLPMPVRKTLKVTVYMGDGWRLDFSHTHFDAYSPPDFYTKIYIIGVPVDVAKRKTKIIEDDWTPYWDEEFTFALRVPELALLRIEVREHDLSDKDDFGGQTCLPVSELRPGIRSVPLYDKKGNKFKSVRLLMRFQFE